MAKEPGYAFAVTVDDSAGAAKVISNDVGSLQFATPRGVQDVTGVDLSAIERQLLLADFSVTLTIPAFNDAADRAHVVFKTVSSSSVARTTTLALSGQSIAPEVLYTDYQLARAQDGSLVSTVPGVLANGVVPTWS